MVYWSGQTVTGTSDEYGLMEDLRQIREMDEEEESLFYSRYDLRRQDDDEEDYEDDVDEDYDDIDEDEDLDDYDDEDDLIDDEDLEEVNEEDKYN